MKINWFINKEINNRNNNNFKKIIIFYNKIFNNIKSLKITNHF